MVYGERLQRQNDKKADKGAREHSRNDLLEKEKQQMSEKKLTFNITYYQVFRNVRSIMEDLYILLAPNKEHKRYFLMCLLQGFGMAGASRITCLEPNYPNLTRVEDVNHLFRNDSAEITRISSHRKQLNRIIYKNYLFGSISCLKVSI